MKRVVAFLGLVIALDVAAGALLHRLYRQTLTGERGGLTNYALSKDADLLILGSSRAQYHFMPSVLDRRLNAHAFNAGLKGHDFLYSILFYDLWRRSHPPPRALVLQIDMESLLEREQELAALQIFAPYLDDSEKVKEALYQSGPYKRLELLSRVYRYNGKALSIAKNLFVSPDRAFDGFMQGQGTMDPDGELGLSRHGLLDVVRGGSDEMALALSRQPFSQAKVGYLRELMDEVAREQTRLFLVHSPLFGQNHEAHQQWTARLKELIDGHAAVELLDLCDVAYPELSDAGLFLNFNHLNGRGAEIFSNLLAGAMETRLPAARVATTAGRKP